MEEALKSARASFRLFAVFLFLVVSYVLTTDLGTGVNLIFSKFERIQEIHAGQNYRRWVESEESSLVEFKDDFLSRFNRLVDESNLKIYSKPYSGFLSALVFNPLHSNMYDASVAHFFRELVQVQDKPGGIIVFDIDEAIRKVEDQLPNVLTECGVFVSFALAYESQPGWHNTVFFGEHWIYDGLSSPDDSCRENSEMYDIEVNVDGRIELRESLTISRWLLEEYNISDISNFFSNSELRTFGMIPIRRSFSDGFDSIRLILDEADRGESNLEFIGVKIAPRFIALMVPLICTTFYVILALQMLYIIRSIRILNSDEINALRHFPSPIVREDAASRITLLFLLVLTPIAIISYLIFFAQAGEIVRSYFGTDMLFGSLIFAQLGTCGLFVWAYVRCQIAVVSIVREAPPDLKLD